LRNFITILVDTMKVNWVQNNIVLSHLYYGQKKKNGFEGHDCD